MTAICPHCNEMVTPDYLTHTYWCCTACNVCCSSEGWEMEKRIDCTICGKELTPGEPHYCKDTCFVVPVVPAGSCDQVHQPAHYRNFPKEVIEIIHATLGNDAFCSYCTGNELKYRLRAGDKGDAAQDMDKAMQYRRFRLNVEAGRGPLEDA